MLLGLLVLEVHLVAQATSVPKDCQALVEGQGRLELLDGEVKMESQEVQVNPVIQE